MDKSDSNNNSNNVLNKITYPETVSLGKIPTGLGSPPTVQAPNPTQFSAMRQSMFRPSRIEDISDTDLLSSEDGDEKKGRSNS